MRNRRQSGSPVAPLLALAGAAAGAYGSYAAMAYLRYGHPLPAPRDASDERLDRFIPVSYTHLTLPTILLV